MARWRTVDAAIWQNPKVRKLGMVAHRAYLYLVTALADDEGRFAIDTLAIRDGAFSSEAAVTKEDVGKALTQLRRAHLINTYGGRRYGFLVGWYEHQYINPDRRQESSLPEPPALIASWRQCESIREQYMAATGKSPRRALFVDAVRWFLNSKSSAGQQSDDTASTDSRRSDNLKGSGSRKGKGRGSKDGASKKPDAATAQKQLTEDQEVILTAWEAHRFGELPKGTLPGYSGLVKLLRQFGYTPVREWTAAILASPPVVTDGADPWDFFCKQFRTAMNRPWEWDGSRDEHRKKPSRELAEYQKQHGKELGLL